MDIFKKIDEIREKPEHVRRRYVWVFVLIFMFLIIGIWIISLKNNLNGSRESIKDSNRLDIMGGSKNETITSGNTSGNYQEYYNQLQGSTSSSDTIKKSETNTKQSNDSGVGSLDLSNLGQ